MKQLQGLLAFVEAATSGSLTAAAERLEVTPAAVSKSLSRLEEQLGVRLLNRARAGSLSLMKAPASWPRRGWRCARWTMQ